MADEAVPVKITRTLYRGDSRTWTHVFTDTATGDPIDITGWTFTAQFRPDLDRGTVVCASVCTVVDGPNGIVTEVLSSTEADKLPGQTSPTVKPVVYWDLQSIDTDSNTQTWKFAACKVMGDSTDA